MYKKETADKKHHTNPYRAVNYIRDENGNPICPNGRKFLFKRKQHVRYKKYGRTEEIYPSLLSVGTSVSLAETYFTAPFFAYIIFLRWISILERR